jgi:DNA-binding CsgD family transcriptional regulator
VRGALGVRETQILQLVAAGLTTEEIAVTLSIAEPTVEWHIARVFEKLGASDRADAVAIMLREGAPDAPRIADRVSPRRRLLPGVSVAATVGVLFAILAGTAFAALYIREQQHPETPSAAPVRGPATAAPPATEAPPASSGVDVPPSPTPGSAGATPGSGSVPAPPATPAFTPATAPLASLVPPAAPNTAPPALTPLPTLPVPAPTPPAAPSLPGIPTLPPLPTAPIVSPPLLP